MMKNVTFKKLATALFLTVSFIPAYAQEGMAMNDILGDLQRLYVKVDDAGTACDAQSGATDADIMRCVEEATAASAKLAADCKAAGIDGDPIIARFQVVANEYQEAMVAGEQGDFKTLRARVAKVGERVCRLDRLGVQKKLEEALASSSHKRPLASHSDQSTDE